MAQIGNKTNSWLNGEWAAHGRRFGKKFGNKRRRTWDRNVIREQRYDTYRNSLKRG